MPAFAFNFCLPCAIININKVLLLCRYLAPEYAQSGQITEKADVYSFGVVLVELVTGRKAVDLNRPKGQQCLTEWVCSKYFCLLSVFEFKLLDSVIYAL